MVPTAKRYRWTAEQKLQMVALYAEGYSLPDVAERMGCTRETIRYHLRRQGVERRGVGMQSAIAKAKYSGEKHHGWKGGRYLDHGYVSILQRDHPHADQDGYVHEHRCVVEQHLLATDPGHPALEGGLLSRAWVVHHRNHQKADNRLENLQVMPKAQHSALHNQLGRYHAEMRSYVSYLERLLEASGVPFVSFRSPAA